MSDTQAAAYTPTADELAKIAKLEEQVTKINAKIAALKAGKPVVAKVAKVVFVPEVGAKVLATIGRATATSQPRVLEALVLGVKKPAEGEKGSTLVRAQVGEGFDAQVFTLFLTQVAPVPVAEEAEEDDGISNEPVGTLNV